MSDKYLDQNGLAYFWQKIKAYGNTHWGGGGASGTPIPTADEVAEFDSTAHMNSTDMTTGSGGEVEDFVNSLNVSAGNLDDAIANYLKGAIVHEFYTIPSRSYAANSIHWHYNDARIPTKTGYKAIGIVGFAQDSSSLVSNLELLDGRIGGYTWNRTSSAVSIAITVDILYLRNDLVAT